MMTDVYWITCRSMADMCATSHRALLEGLTRKGINTTLLNADEGSLHADEPWSHCAVRSSTVPGMVARTMARHAKRWIAQQSFKEGTVVVVDWRMASALAPALNRHGVPWAVLDRSPPAHHGWLSKLQWPVWVKAWRLLNRHSEVRGFVVSPRHRDLVCRRVGVHPSQITVLPTGTDVDLFTPGIRKERTTLVYHGRLDKNRGVLALPMLVSKARQANVDVDLCLIGDGDAVKGLQRIAQSMPGVELRLKCSQGTLANLIGECHIGLLPMPFTEVWSVASPLKQSEYAAAGLPMLGIDHAGHQLRGHREASWLKLVPQEDFFDKGVEWLKSLIEGDYERASRDVRAFAEHELQWDSTVDALHDALQAMLVGYRV